MYKYNFIILIGFIAFFLPFKEAASQTYTSPASTVIIKDHKGKYIPFTSFKPPVFEIKNDLLNIAFTDRNGDMIQINGISKKSLKDTVLAADAFQTIYITRQMNETYTDVTYNTAELVIKCNSPDAGSDISFSLTTKVKLNKKVYRIYALLNGTIPLSTYQSTRNKL